MSKDDKYDSLANVLREALEQASAGKGKERHAGEGEAFEDQQIVQLGEWLGTNHFQLGQACKKILESARLPPGRARVELLGAINYIAAAVIQTDRAEVQRKLDAATYEAYRTERDAEPFDPKRVGVADVLHNSRRQENERARLAAERVLRTEADATVPGVEQVTDFAPPTECISGCIRKTGHKGGCMRGGVLG